MPPRVGCLAGCCTARDYSVPGFVDTWIQAPWWPRPVCSSQPLRPARELTSDVANPYWTASNFSGWIGADALHDLRKAARATPATGEHDRSRAFGPDGRASRGSTPPSNRDEIDFFRTDRSARDPPAAEEPGRGACQRRSCKRGARRAARTDRRQAGRRRRTITSTRSISAPGGGLGRRLMPISCSAMSVSWPLASSKKW